MPLLHLVALVASTTVIDIMFNLLVSLLEDLLFHSLLTPFPLQEEPEGEFDPYHRKKNKRAGGSLLGMKSSSTNVLAT